MDYVLKTNSLCKRFYKFKALDGLTMNVPKGSIYGFVGENGTLVVNRDGWEVIPENVSGNKRMEAVELHKPYGGGGLELHVKNHLECIKARTPEKCHASIQIGAHIAKFAHLGNIAYRTGKKLTWDGTSFHDKEADKYLCKEYHNKWKFPKV